MDGIDPTNGKPLPTDADVDAALGRLARFKSKPPYGQYINGQYHGASGAMLTSNQTDQELRARLRALQRTDRLDHRYPIDAYEDDLIALIKADRQKMIEKLSFHLGVDVKTLQGYLESKVSK